MKIIYFIEIPNVKDQIPSTVIFPLELNQLKMLLINNIQLNTLL